MHSTQRMHRNLLRKRNCHLVTDAGFPKVEAAMLEDCSKRMLGPWQSQQEGGQKDMGCCFELLTMPDEEQASAALVSCHSWCSWWANEAPVKFGLCWSTISCKFLISLNSIHLAITDWKALLLFLNGFAFKRVPFSSGPRPSVTDLSFVNSDLKKWTLLFMCWSLITSFWFQISKLLEDCHLTNLPLGFWGSNS